MLQRQSGQFQLKLSWNPENGVWPGMPEAKRSDCQAAAGAVPSVRRHSRKNRKERKR